MNSNPPRACAIIADGSALFLDKDGNKIARRKFTNDEVAIQIDVSRPVTLIRLANIASKFSIASTLVIHDWRFYCPRDGHEISENEMAEKYEGGREGGYITRKKDYRYNVKLNSLRRSLNSVMLRRMLSRTRVRLTFLPF